MPTRFAALLPAAGVAPARRRGNDPASPHRAEHLLRRDRRHHRLRQHRAGRRHEGRGALAFPPLHGQRGRDRHRQSDRADLAQGRQLHRPGRGDPPGWRPAELALGPRLVQQPGARQVRPRRQLRGRRLAPPQRQRAEEPRRPLPARPRPARRAPVPQRSIRLVLVVHVESGLHRRRVQRRDEPRQHPRHRQAVPGRFGSSNVSDKEGSVLGVWPVRDGGAARERRQPSATAPSAP